MATATYRAEGTRVDYTPDGADVDAGAVIEFAAMIGIATQAIEAGDKGSLAISGIFSMPKPTGDGGIDQGVVVYWDAGEVNASATGSYLGKSAVTAEDGDTVVDVVINVNE